jgi:hypothetical protein
MRKEKKELSFGDFRTIISDELNDNELKIWNGFAWEILNEMFILMQRDGLNSAIKEIKLLTDDKDIEQ